MSHRSVERSTMTWVDRLPPSRNHNPGIFPVDIVVRKPTEHVKLSIDEDREHHTDDVIGRTGLEFHGYQLRHALKVKFLLGCA